MAIADAQRNQVVEVRGAAIRVVGDGDAGYVDGPAGQAEFYELLSVAIDDELGDVLVGEYCHIRSIGPDGGVITLAGDGARTTGEFSLGLCAQADGTVGPGGTASLFWPESVVAAGGGGVYFSDYNAVRRILGGTVTTLARTAYLQTMTLDYGLALLWDGQDLQEASPAAPCVDDQTCGEVVVIAGSSGTGYVDGPVEGDGGALFGGQYGSISGFGQIARCPDGRVYLADPVNNAIRVVSPNGNNATLIGGSVSTLIGDGPDCWLDGGPGSGTLDHPLGVACDAQGVIYIADTGHARILVARP
ncbi:MAG: NHL repeat-containing protein [Myxococcales bacterium]